MTRPSILSALAAIVAPLLLAGACGGADAPAKQSTPPTAASNAETIHGGCVATFQRQRECTAEFIPALVAARVQADQPPGIAAKDAEIGRDALVAGANEEWAEDSTDAAISATCDRIVASIPPEQQGALIEQGDQCRAATDCQAFVDCVIPVVSQHFGH